LYSILDEIVLNKQASRLEELARSYEALYADIKKQIDSLSEWSSPAASEWRSLTKIVASRALISANEMRSVAGSIRNFTASHKHLLEKIVDEIKGESKQNDASGTR